MVAETAGAATLLSDPSRERTGVTFSAAGAYRFAFSVNDVFGDNNKRAVLMVPREEFCLPINRSHAYDIDFLDIGFGVTISGPGLVARMTSTPDSGKLRRAASLSTGEYAVLHVPIDHPESGLVAVEVHSPTA